jgi:hypothetical protein
MIRGDDLSAEFHAIKCCAVHCSAVRGIVMTAHAAEREQTLSDRLVRWPLKHGAVATQATRPGHRVFVKGCVSFSGTSNSSICALLKIPRDSATSSMGRPVAIAVLAIKAAFS